MVAPYKPGNPPSHLDWELQRYLAEELNKLAGSIGEIAAGAFDNLVAKGYGAIYRTSDEVIGTMPAASTFSLLNYDFELPDPYDVTTDLVLGHMAANRTGKWFVSVVHTWTHDELNAGRTWDLLLWDDTDNKELVRVEFGTGRNTSTSSGSLAFIADVVPEEMDHNLQLRVLVNDQYLSAAWQTTFFNIHHISELTR